MNYINSLFTDFSMSYSDIGLLMLVGFLVGAAKGGLKGVGTAAVPIFALIFGAKESTGILLPILIIADTGAVLYYYKKAQWSKLLKLLPSAIIGILLATWVGSYISAQTFKYLMGGLILFCLLLLLLWEKMGDKLMDVSSPILGYSTGVGLGFTTMIGNAAGPLMNIYMLLLQMPKTAFIATTAVFFYIVNLIKVPFHIFVWNTITLKTVQLGLLTLPAVALGLFFGVYIVKMMSERIFKWLVIIATALSALLLLIK